MAGDTATDVVAAVGSIDPSRALSIIERVEPIATRLITSTGGLAMLACLALGVVLVMYGRRTDARQILNG